MIDEIRFLTDKRLRAKREPEMLQKQLRNTGAQVLELRSIARLVPMPFDGLRPMPMLYEIRAVHNERRGCWYVRTAADSDDADWVWYDSDGYDNSPLPDLGHAVTGELTPVSWTRDWIVVGGMISIGVAVALWLAL